MAVDSPDNTQQMRPPGMASSAVGPSHTNSIGSAILQNTKSGSSGTWGFGTPAGGIPGLGGVVSRQASTGPTSFAQTIGGPSTTGSLDMSEFPSLSGNAQAQAQNSASPAIWQQKPSGQRSHPDTASSSIDDVFIGPGQGRVAKSSADDFPPLGRHVDVATDGLNPFREFARRDVSQTRQSLLSGLAHINGAQAGSHTDRPLSPNAFSDGVDNILSSLDRTSISRPSGLETRQTPPRQSDLKTHSLPARTGLAGSPKHDLASISGGKSHDRESYGIASLVADFKSEDPVVAGLARGQDLSQLGLNLASPDPIWPTWTGPFPDSASRPLQPDFTLPDCYTVTNIHRVRDKLPGFSDETLFWIFYTQPMDILQDVAAAELTSRNWRYHKQLQMWLTKDPTLPEPRRITDDMETGSYIFWNQREWARVRQTDFILEYALLAPTNLRGGVNAGGGRLPIGAGAGV